MLSELSLSDMEMPGQYLAGNEVTPDNLVMLEYIGSNVAIARRHSTSYRRLQLYGSDGNVRYMLVQTGQNWAQGTTDERIIQLMRLLNKLLATQPQARSRLLAWHTPMIIPVWPQASAASALAHGWGRDRLPVWRLTSKPPGLAPGSHIVQGPKAHIEGPRSWSCAPAFGHRQVM